MNKYRWSFGVALIVPMLCMLIAVLILKIDIPNWADASQYSNMIAALFGAVLSISGITIPLIIALQSSRFAQIDKDITDQIYHRLAFWNAHDRMKEIVRSRGLQYSSDNSKVNGTAGNIQAHEHLIHFLNLLATRGEPSHRDTFDQALKNLFNSSSENHFRNNEAHNSLAYFIPYIGVFTLIIFIHLVMWTAFGKMLSNFYPHIMAVDLTLVWAAFLLNVFAYLRLLEIGKIKNKLIRAVDERVTTEGIAIESYVKKHSDEAIELKNQMEKDYQTVLVSAIGSKLEDIIEKLAKRAKPQQP
jgi:phosphoribosyl-ATP pyrophosphohydrolase